MSQSLKKSCVVFAVVLRTNIHFLKKIKEGEKIYPIYCTYTFLYRKKKKKSLREDDGHNLHWSLARLSEYKPLDRHSDRHKRKGKKAL